MLIKAYVIDGIMLRLEHLILASDLLDQLAAGDYDDEASLWDVVYYRLKETIKRVERAGEERALK